MMTLLFVTRQDSGADDSLGNFVKGKTLGTASASKGVLGTLPSHMVARLTQQNSDEQQSLELLEHL